MCSRLLSFSFFVSFRRRSLYARQTAVDFLVILRQKERAERMEIHLSSTLLIKYIDEVL